MDKYNGFSASKRLDLFGQLHSYLLAMDQTLVSTQLGTEIPQLLGALTATLGTSIHGTKTESAGTAESAGGIEGCSDSSLNGPYGLDGADGTKFDQFTSARIGLETVRSAISWRHFYRVIDTSASSE